MLVSYIIDWNIHRDDYLMIYTTIIWWYPMLIKKNTFLD
jgi:hypothetical protein